MTSVLDLMLYSYAFMVSGLTVPTVAMLVLRRPSPTAAVVSMVLGGSCTISLSFLFPEDGQLPLGLDANLFGIGLSLVTFVLLQMSLHQRERASS